MTKSASPYGAAPGQRIAAHRRDRLDWELTTAVPDESSAVKAAISYFGVTDARKMFGRPRDELSTMMVPSPEDILFRTSVIDHPEAAAPGNPLN